MTDQEKAEALTDTLDRIGVRSSYVDWGASGSFTVSVSTKGDDVEFHFDNDQCVVEVL